MLKIDQGYSLKQAIHAFARPEDRTKEENFLDEWQRRFEETKRASRQLETEKIALVEETWLKQELDTKIKLLWDSLLKEFGGQIPERGAAALSCRNPITHGLLEALRNGAAVAFGRRGGLQYPKEQIEASVWDGEWEFQMLGGFAKGGVPHIEILDVTVFLREPVSSRAVVPPALPLPAARKRELRVFLEELGPCNEKVARQSAEQHFNASITRDLIREQRNKTGVKGKVGRPRKDATKIPPPKQNGEIS
jgi:hypothetical protein